MSATEPTTASTPSSASSPPSGSTTPRTPPPAPVLRQVFDAVERGVAPRLERLVRTEQFAVAAGLASQVQHALQRQASRSTRRMLHLLNLPAGTDVTRILNEIGQLKKQVRDLTAQLDDARAQARRTGGARPHPDQEVELDVVVVAPRPRRAARARSA
jgi:hypothetical protein